MGMALVEQMTALLNHGHTGMGFAYLLFDLSMNWV
jgi:hypothetical protein